VVEVDLPLDANAPGRARTALEPLREAVPAQEFGDLRLLVSELVVDDLRARPQGDDRAIRLEADVRGEVLRVELAEGWAARPAEAASRPEPGDPGWGVYLAELLTDRWGVEPSGDHAVLWLEKLIDSARR
jgi:hypothetical protein